MAQIIPVDGLGLKPDSGEMTGESAERYMSSCGSESDAELDAASLVSAPRRGRSPSAVTRLSARLDELTAQVEAQRRVMDKMREAPDEETAVVWSVDESHDHGGNHDSQDKRKSRLKRVQGVVWSKHTETKEWWSTLQYGTVCRNHTSHSLFFGRFSRDSSSSLSWTFQTAIDRASSRRPILCVSLGSTRYESRTGLSTTLWISILREVSLRGRTRSIPRESRDLKDTCERGHAGIGYQLRTSSAVSPTCSTLSPRTSCTRPLALPRPLPISNIETLPLESLFFSFSLSLSLSREREREIFAIALGARDLREDLSSKRNELTVTGYPERWFASVIDCVPVRLETREPSLVARRSGAPKDSSSTLFKKVSLSYDSFAIATRARGSR